MSGLNHNQNHFCKRIETRVLAPPGGFSSLSLGHSFNDVRRSSAPQPSKNYTAPVTNVKENYTTSYGNREHPSERCIPGLESHYTGSKATSSKYYHEDDEEEENYRNHEPQSSYSARAASMIPLKQTVALTTGRRVLTQDEYAQELRQQIFEKRNRDHMDTLERGGNERRSLSKHAALEEKMRAYGSRSNPVPLDMSGRRTYASSATKSSWTISGN